jgi:hypothetical protein
MTMIYVPHRELWKPDPIEIPYRVRGMYRLRVRGPDRKVRKDTGWFPNLITNQGLDWLYTNGGYFNNFMVGTANTAPANTDTTLAAQIAFIGLSNPQSPSNGNSGTPPYYGYINLFGEFPQGAAAGNLQEIGLGPSSTGVFSRALIVNNVGVPTTLTVLANEFLDVSYQLQLYVPTVDVTGSVTVAGTVCNYTLRAADAAGGSWNQGNFNNYPGLFGMANVTLYSDVALPAITGVPSGVSQGGASSIAHGSYTAGQYYIDATASFGLGAGNGGLNNLALCHFGRVGNMGACSCLFGATIPKTSSQLMTLSFRQTWGRYP